MLLSSDWMMWPKCSENGKVSSHEVCWCSRIQFSIWQIDKSIKSPIRPQITDSNNVKIKQQDLWLTHQSGGMRTASLDHRDFSHVHSQSSWHPVWRCCPVERDNELTNHNKAWIVIGWGNGEVNVKKVPLGSCSGDTSLSTLKKVTVFEEKHKILQFLL